MNISQTLRKFLHSGDKPSSQREASALLDESRSILVSKLPTTAIHIQNLTEGDIDGVLAGGKSGMMERAAAVHREKQSFKPSNAPPTKKVFTKASHPIAKKSAAPRPAVKTVAKTHLQTYSELRLSNPAKARTYLSEHGPAIQAEARAAAKI